MRSLSNDLTICMGPKKVRVELSMQRLFLGLVSVSFFLTIQAAVPDFTSSEEEENYQLLDKVVEWNSDVNPKRSCIIAVNTEGTLLVATSSARNSKVVLWDIQKKEKVDSFLAVAKNGASELSFTENSLEIVEPSGVKVQFDIVTNEALLRKMQTHYGWRPYLKIYNSSKTMLLTIPQPYIAVPAPKPEIDIALWDVEMAMLIDSTVAHLPRQPQKVSFSNDDRKILVALNESELLSFDIVTRDVIDAIGRERAVSDICIKKKSKDGNYVATVYRTDDADYEMWIWDRTGALIDRDFYRGKLQLSSLSFSEHNEQTINFRESINTTSLTIIDANILDKIRNEYTKRNAKIVLKRRSANKILAMDNFGTLKLWNNKGTCLMQNVASSLKNVTCIDFNSDGKTAVVATEAGLFNFPIGF